MANTQGRGHSQDAGTPTLIARPKSWRRAWVFLSGLWIAPLWWVALKAVPFTPHTVILVSLGGLALAPVPALLLYKRCEIAMHREARRASEESERLRLHLETIRYRTGRLREELRAADRQARFSHQLTLLGQFTAGFLHEFNNPLAILTNRIEVLLEERKEDADLCEDLQQMLREARYMGTIAGTLLQALHREREDETFDPCIPSEAMQEVFTSLAPFADKQGVRLVLETAEVPRVNLPSHVIVEVLRTLLTNAIQALSSVQGATVRVRLESFRGPGSNVIMRVEDNGPGVPERLRPHLFEPFASQSTGNDRLGLGLFLAGSLLDTYDGSLRYEPGVGGGACFVVELPPARFTREQPYHWFVKDNSGPVNGDPS